MNRIKARFSNNDFKRINNPKIPVDLRRTFLRRKLGIDERTADLILKHAPKRHEDFIKIRELVVHDRRLAVLLVQASAKYSSFRQQDRLLHVESLDHGNGLVSETRTIEGEGKEQRRQLAIRDCNGDLVTLDLQPDRSPDWSTLHFLGVQTPYLWMLTAEQKGLLHVRLHSVSSEDLSRVMRETRTVKDDLPDRMIRGIAGLLIALQRFTASTYDRRLYSIGANPLSGTVEGGDITGPGDPGSIDIPPDDNRDSECEDVNGCGPEFSKELADFIPEFTFEECCNAHDRAYCQGCSECDRVEADSDFLECMLNSAPASLTNTQLAFIYYLAVRAIGVIPFNHCFDRKGAAGIVGGVVSVIAGVGAGLAALGLALGLLPAAGLGIIVAGASIWLLSKLLCLPCELTDSWLRSVVENIQEYEERIRQEIRKSIKKCKRKRSFWNKLKCWAKTLAMIVLWIIVVIVMVVVTIAITLVRILICGGLSGS